MIAMNLYHTLLCNSVTSVSKKISLTENTETHRNSSNAFLLCNSVLSVRTKNLCEKKQTL